MNTKEPTAQEQAQSDQQKLLEDFLKDNGIGITIVFANQDGSRVMLSSAIKPEYKTPEWVGQIVVVVNGA